MQRSPKRVRHGLLAIRSGLSLRRSLPGISGLRPNTSCIGEVPEIDNTLFLGRVKAFSTLVFHLWLNVSQDVLKHELKQLGIMFHFALLLLRFSSKFHKFDALVFTPIHEIIGDLCAMQIDFEPGRMYGLSHASVHSLCRFCNGSASLSLNGITACLELPSQTTCRVFTRSPGIHPGSSCTSIAMLLRGGWTSHAGDCRATRGCLTASPAGHSKCRVPYRVCCVARACRR